MNAALGVDEKSIEVILKSPDYDILVAAVSDFRFLYNPKLETEKAKNLLESSNTWKTIWNFIIYPNYLQLAWTEYTDSGLNPKDCILFLGSSPLPLSIIVLCRECDLFGIGIEQDGKKCSPFRAGNAHIELSNSIES